MVVQQMLPAVIRMASDPIPNIRFNVAKALAKFLPLFDPMQDAGPYHQIQACLSQLNSDADKDVRYFANCALMPGIAV